MSSFHIEELHVEGFGCLRNVDAMLTPLHAFIGPNDSGKSTLLRAVRTAVQFAGATFIQRRESHAWYPFDPGFSPRPTPFSLRLHGEGGRWAYEVGRRSEAGFVDSIIFEDAEVESQERKWKTPSVLAGIFSEGKPDLKLEEGVLTREESAPSELSTLRNEFMHGARLLHLNPSSLREPSELIPEADAVRLQDESGLGLPAVYDTILNRGDDSFLKLVDEVQRLFPTVKAVRLKVVSPSTKALEVELKTGERVPAKFMSEGLLYYLAFAALRFLAPTAVVLIEEIENGLHPARIREVMGIMRELSKTTQVLIATHSPLVINELSGEEVSVVTRHPEEGTRVMRLRDTADYETRSKIYANGELWLSYANGVDERELIKGVGRHDAEAAPRG
jgi:predicted ATPase